MDGLFAWVGAGSDPQNLPLPLSQFQDVSTLHSILGHPVVKSLIPFPIVGAILPALWWMFRDTWLELDREATAAEGC